LWGCAVLQRGEHSLPQILGVWFPTPHDAPNIPDRQLQTALDSVLSSLARLAETLAGMHFMAFAIFMLERFVERIVYVI
jgi:hypothetical protein